MCVCGWVGGCVRAHAREVTTLQVYGWPSQTWPGCQITFPIDELCLLGDTPQVNYQDFILHCLLPKPWQPSVMDSYTVPGWWAQEIIPKFTFTSTDNIISSVTQIPPFSAESCNPDSKLNWFECKLTTLQLA